MKVKLTILTLLATFLFYHSFGKEILTKEEAKKQIVKDNYDKIYASFYLNKYIDKHNVPDNITALMNAGFINCLTSNKSKTGDLKIIVLKKGQPFFIDEENNKLHFSVGVIPIEIISITKPSSGLDGNDVCNVKYKETISHNAFFKVWNPHCLKEGVFIEQAKFTKIGKGWKIVDLQ